MGGWLSRPKLQLDLVRVMPDDRSLFRAIDAGLFLIENPGEGDGDVQKGLQGTCWPGRTAAVAATAAARRFKQDEQFGYRRGSPPSAPKGGPTQRECSSWPLAPQVTRRRP